MSEEKTALTIWHDIFLESKYLNMQDFFIECLMIMTINQAKSIHKAARYVRDKILKEHSAAASEGVK